MLESEPYQGGRAYAQSKLAQVFYDLRYGRGARRHGRDDKRRAPGRLPRYEHDKRARVNGEYGARKRAPLSVINAARSPEAGDSISTRMNVARANDQAYDMEARRQLRELSMELAGLD